MFKFKFVFLPLLIIAVVIIMIINFIIGGFSLFGESRAVHEVKTASLAGVTELSVDSVSSDVKVILTDDSELKAHFYGTANSSSESNLPKLEVTRTGDSVLVKIKWPMTRLWNIGGARLNLDVYLPKSYAQSLSVSTVSADIDAGALSVKALSLKTISGDIDGAGLVSVGDAKLSTVSGDVEVEIVCKELTFGTVSGGVTLSNLSAETVFGKTTSGSVNIDGSFGETKLSSVSGSMNISNEKMAGDISLSTTSGSMNLGLPQEAGFDLDFSAVSGSFSNDFTAQYEVKDDHKVRGTVGNGEYEVKISSVSGSVSISKD